MKLLNLEFDLKLIILPIIYISLGIIIFEIIKNILSKIIKLSPNNKNSHNQRLKTVNILILNIIKYIICIFVILAILSTFGVNVRSILAGLGIGTAIIGLAFQDLAKDIIAGIFIISEDQYEVGQTIEVDGFMGGVIFVGLKTTRIKDFKGAVKIISNRNMDKIINYSLNNSLALIDLNIPYDNSPLEVEKVLEKIITDVNKNIKYAKGDLHIIGVNALEDSSVVHRLGVEVVPVKNFEVERYLKKEFLTRLLKSNIKIPYPQIEVHNGKK